MYWPKAIRPSILWLDINMNKYSFKISISKILFIRYIHLCGFINSNVINVGSLIDPYIDIAITTIVWVRRYRLNILFKLTQNFKN